MHINYVFWKIFFLNGFYRLKAKKHEPVKDNIRIVSETQDTVNKARSQLDHERESYKRKSASSLRRPPPGKRAKSIKLPKNQYQDEEEEDIFSY